MSLPTVNLVRRPWLGAVRGAAGEADLEFLVYRQISPWRCRKHIIVIRIALSGDRRVSGRGCYITKLDREVGATTVLVPILPPSRPDPYRHIRLGMQGFKIDGHPHAGVQDNTSPRASTCRCLILAPFHHISKIEVFQRICSNPQ